MKTLVVGLGNPILGDDGVGWKVAEEVQKQLPADVPVDVDFLSLGGISLMERLIGYDNVILIDAFAQEDSESSISVLKLSDLPNDYAIHTTSAHDVSLQNALKLGGEMGADLPHNITVVGVGIKQICDFSESLSPSVADAVPYAAHIALNMLKQITARDFPLRAPCLCGEME